MLLRKVRNYEIAGKQEAATLKKKKGEKREIFKS
jgi:hypothetical protein